LIALSLVVGTLLMDMFGSFVGLLLVGADVALLFMVSLVNLLPIHFEEELFHKLADIIDTCCCVAAWVMHEKLVTCTRGKRVKDDLLGCGSLVLIDFLLNLHGCSWQAICVAHEGNHSLDMTANFDGSQFLACC
jgi:hypothetical protein